MDPDLTAYAQAKTILETHWGADAKSCAICGKNSWYICEVVTIPIERRPRESWFCYPMLPVSCEGCGHTLWFNAVKLGLVPGEPEPIVVPPPSAPDPPRQRLSFTECALQLFQGWGLVMLLTSVGSLLGLGGHCLRWW